MSFVWFLASLAAWRESSTSAVDFHAMAQSPPGNRRHLCRPQKPEFPSW
jgi:hypothetical protein